jgi:phosphonate transport system substrate-binding protein
MKYAVRQKFAQQRARAAQVRRRLRVLAGAAVVMLTGAMAVPAAAPTVFKVRPGDTFSGIAAKVTGKARDWNKLYDAQRSQLPDPDYILPGMRFQLVSEADGSRYLRLATPAQLAEAKAETSKRLAANKAPGAIAAPSSAVPAAPVLGVPKLNAKAADKSPKTASVAPAAVAPIAPAPPLVSAAVTAVKPMPVPVPVPAPSPVPASLAGTPAKSGMTAVPLPLTPAPAAAPLQTPTSVGLTAAAKPNLGLGANNAVPVPLPAGLTPIAPAKPVAEMAAPVAPAQVQVSGVPPANPVNNPAANSPVAAAAKTAALAVAAAVAPAPAATAAAVALTPLSAGGDTLVIGVMPNISASVLATQYDKLKTYLERSTSQKVRVVVPTSMKAYFEAMVRGDYDLAIGGPHFARLAQVDARLVPVAMFEPRTNAQFVTLLDGPMKSPRDLRGKAVVFSNPQSLVAMYGRQWLGQQSLEQGRDYDVKSARTDLGVGRMLLSGDAVAAVMSSGEFRTLPADEAARLKIVEVIARIPNFVVMAHARLGTERVARLKAKLQSFLADKNEGAAFAKATGVSGIVDADETVLRELDPFVAATRRMMVPAP